MDLWKETKHFSVESVTYFRIAISQQYLLLPLSNDVLLSHHFTSVPQNHDNYSLSLSWQWMLNTWLVCVGCYSLYELSGSWQLRHLKTRTQVSLAPVAMIKLIRVMVLSSHRGQGWTARVLDKSSSLVQDHGRCSCVECPVFIRQNHRILYLSNWDDLIPFGLI
jgi:hypothetical protein